MEYLWSGVLVCAVTILLTWCGWFGRKRRHPVRVITGVDILQVLQNVKIFPVGCLTNWQLCDYTHDQRVWVTEVSSSYIPRPITVYGCVAKLKGSPQTILTSLKDVTKYAEWTPGVVRVKKIKNIFASGDEEVAIPKLSGSAATPVYHEVIQVVSNTTLIGTSVLGLVNKVSTKVQGVPLVHAIDEVHRYFCKEEKDICWLLEMNESSQGWSFYLIQPTDNFFEIDQCCMTLVHFSPHNLFKSAETIEAAAKRLGSFCQYFTFRKVQCTPVTNISLPVASIEDTKSISDGTSTKSCESSRPGSPKLLTRNADKDEPNFIKKFKSMIEEKKEKYKEEKRVEEEKKRKKDVPSKEVKENKAKLASSILLQNPSGHLLKEPDLIDSDDPSAIDSDVDIDRRGSSDSLFDAASLSRFNKQRLSTSSQSSEPPRIRGTGSSIERKSILKNLRSNESTSNSFGDSFESTFNLNRDKGVDDDSSKNSSSERRDSNQSDTVIIPESASTDTPSETVIKETFAQRFIRKMKSLDQTKDEVTLDQETPESTTEDTADEESVFADEDVIDEEEYRNIAESVAKDLLAEKARVSHLDISRPLEEQAEQTNGWIYCGLEKDVVILRKIYSSGTPFQCYLGKGLIPAPPKVVFEAVKNPLTRFTYDEMLKKVEVLHDFQNGMRIVYLYHEVSQLFRKEARDFCVLQTEQISGVKYVISLRSVTYPECPESEDIIRGKFLPSGWIIEPVTKDNKLYSMVTYIVQMELGMSKSPTGYLIAELAAKQPMSIVHLRQLVGPSGSNSKPGHQSNRRRRSLVTLAAAASSSSEKISRSASCDINSHQSENYKLQKRYASEDIMKLKNSCTLPSEEEDCTTRKETCSYETVTPSECILDKHDITPMQNEELAKDDETNSTHDEQSYHIIV